MKSLELSSYVTGIERVKPLVQLSAVDALNAVLAVLHLRFYVQLSLIYFTRTAISVIIYEGCVLCFHAYQSFL